MAKKVDPKAKAKRQKIILICVSVLFVLLMAIQGPKTLKMLTAKAPADESHAPATSAVAPTAPVVPGAVAPVVSGVAPTPTAQTAAVVTEGIGIADTSQAPAPGDGQLVSFGRFKTKDPFVQQVSESPDGAPVTAVTTNKPATAPPTPTEPPAVTNPPAVAGPTTPTAPPVVVPTRPTSATISVNGTSEPVDIKASFPKSSPTFTLLGLTKTVAKIGIVGGSYSDGGSAITLKLGKTVTLMNTADGTRYKLRLVSVATS